MKHIFSKASRNCFILFILIGTLSYEGLALAEHQEIVQGKKVMVVASYHSEYKWVGDIVDSLKKNLQGAQLTFFYMDTKRNLEGAAEKAREAFELFQKLQPDAVITIDDNAQSYFVVPYLMNKVQTPVVFCGVNDDASKYGFPAGNVTGVLEKKHYREAVSFAKVIEPNIRNVAVLYKKNPSNDINLSQIEREKETYAATIVEIVEVNTLSDVRQALDMLVAVADALFLLNMTGIADDNDKQIEGHDVIRFITDLTNLVTIGASDWEIEAGALCGVIKSGDEQGSLAADQLVAIWEGRKPQDVPLVENTNGQRYLSVSTLKKLNIKLKPEVVIGTKMIVPQ